MQSSWTQALGVFLALSVVSCGDSEPYSDPFQGYIDTSVLDTKFRPTGRCGGQDCYLTQVATVNGDPVVFFNLGTVAHPNSDKSTPPPPIAAETVTGTVYEFPDGCDSEGQKYDRRLDAYDPTQQYPVFKQLPLAPSSSSAPAVLPLVRVVRWMGSGDTLCNAIKDASSVEEFRFSGSRVEGPSTVGMRAVITSAEVRLASGASYAAPLGWYKGLLLNYLDAGELNVDAKGNLVTMDGVLVHPPTGTSSVTANNVLVLFARPGEVGWSPVVRLREFRAAEGSKVSDYRSLCYDAPCPTGAVDMSKATTYSGTLFLVGGAP